MPSITLSRQRHGLLTDCLADRAEPLARSPRFAVYHLEPDRTAGPIDLDDIILVHDFAPSEIDNNIGCHVADELLPLLAGLPRSEACDGYAPSEQEVFEHFVGEIVRSMDGNERRAWHLFYDNTLAALHRAGQQANGADGGNLAPQDFIGDFAAIYRRVADLIAEIAPATLLDAATCFGFMPLLLAAGAWAEGDDAQEPRQIVACDLNLPLIALAETYARQRRLTSARFVHADVLAPDLTRKLAPLGPTFDIVTSIHLLEHLEPEQTAAAMDALWSLTRRRLIVTVPVEAVPDPRFGHRQVFDRKILSALGQRTDGTCRYFEHHGAWLVIDRSQDQGIEKEGLA